MSTNDITGDALRSKATTEKYRDNFEAIFRPLCTDCGKRQDMGMIHTCTEVSKDVPDKIRD